MPRSLQRGRVLQDLGDDPFSVIHRKFDRGGAATKFVGTCQNPNPTLGKGVTSHRDPMRGSSGPECAVPSQLQARREPRALRTGFRSTPMPETSTSQTSPCFIALVEPGVPV